jgi:hypothetical protein
MHLLAMVGSGNQSGQTRNFPGRSGRFIVIIGSKWIKGELFLIEGKKMIVGIQM